MSKNTVTTAASQQLEFYSRKQASQILNTSEAWLRKQDRLGSGPAKVRWGKCVRYSRAALLAFAESRAVPQKAA
jgi:hypothetical protein